MYSIVNNLFNAIKTSKFLYTVNAYLCKHCGAYFMTKMSNIVFCLVFILWILSICFSSSYGLSKLSLFPSEAEMHFFIMFMAAVTIAWQVYFVISTIIYIITFFSPNLLAYGIPPSQCGMNWEHGETEKKCCKLRENLISGKVKEELYCILK